ncbi:hypothetical protein JCM33374_g5506 [Metschnikowia sp. JCM 33374]|nr:hypothetical protein JCM33374_g5506 [Metschnikowia sp. JCM 33374]
MTQPPEKAFRQVLPPFSFSKRPIKNTLPTSAIPPNINKTFSNISKPVDQPSFNNINYDDKIRAPRMSSANQYTYKPESPRPFTDKKNSTASTEPHRSDSFNSGNDVEMYDPSQEDHLGNSLRAGPEGLVQEHNEPATDYQPATVDLNQPTRRNSEPIKKQWGISVGNILSLDGVEYPGLSSQILAAEPNMEQLAPDENSALMQQKLLRAVNNLNANITSEERSAGTDSVHNFTTDHGGRNRDYVSDEGPAIQQVYTQKKPMCRPAVLRAPSEIDRINEEDFLHDSSPDEDSPAARLSEYPFEIPEDPATSQTASRVEPTHEHWRPNNSSDHCMNCFEGFRGFFNPQKRGRHHCRFCGLLYCQNCLYKNREALSFEIHPPASSDAKTPTRANSGSSNASSVISNISATSAAYIEETTDGVMLDSKARIVIPLFKNLTEQGMGLSSLQEKFKLCKVCKTCGHNSSRLLYLLNQRSRSKNDIDTPYVFIENPYMGNTSTFHPQPLYDMKSAGSKSNLRKKSGSERRSSYNNVPSDWTWSSF